MLIAPVGPGRAGLLEAAASSNTSAFSRAAVPQFMRAQSVNNCAETFSACGGCVNDSPRPAIGRSNRSATRWTLIEVI